jgi:hypothetical protein
MTSNNRPAAEVVLSVQISVTGAELAADPRGAKAQAIRLLQQLIADGALAAEADGLSAVAVKIAGEHTVYDTAGDEMDASLSGAFKS